jgi:transcriptional regulator with XRE-family HTH domain
MSDDLSARRRALGLSQDTLARRADCSTAMVRLLEAGYQPDGSEVLGRIQSVLNSEDPAPRRSSKKNTMKPRSQEPQSAVIIHASPVAVDRVTAAAMLGMGLDSFERYVQGNIKLIRRGRLRLVPIRELERWAAANAE